MIANYLGKVKKNHRGSSFVSPALGWARQGRLFRSPFAKNFLEKPQARAGREGKGGWGKRIPAPPERIFRNQRRDSVQNEFGLFLTNTTLDDLFRPRPSLRSGLGLRRAENIKTKFY